MELYLLKSAACLAILLLFYKTFLEKESFHVFKRFYLLIGLLIAFCIPFLTFTYYVEASPIMDSTLLTETQSIPFVQKTEEVIAFNWLAILWPIYGMGVLFFGIRFMLNLSRIANRIVSNQKLKHNKFINVLLTDLVIPHTFFNYIFLNKSKFEKQEIPQEVLLHEQTHAKQKHSVDVLLIEILQILFWFNPLIYILKHAVKLNHEFLADQAVINQGVSPTTYQQLLLAFSSHTTEPLPIAIGMANAINYSSIKKRFTVMKTRTSKKNAWIKSFILLPLLAILIFSFSDKKSIERTEEAILMVSPQQQKSASRDQMAEYNKLAIHYNIMLKKRKDITIKMKHVERMKYIYGIMSDKQRNDAEPFPNFPKPPKAPEVMETEVPMAPPPPPIPANATPAQKAKYKAVIANYAKKHPNSVTKVKNAEGELIEVVEVPTNVLEVAPPPPPPEPVKHMKQLAKEGASFYYEGKEISAKQAIKIAQEKDGINIQVQDHMSEKPIVKLSTKPIQLKKHN